MAPVYPACHLSVCCLSQFGVPVVPVHLTSVLFILFMILHWFHAVLVLTYDRQALLNIKSCMGLYRGWCPVLHSYSQSSFNQPTLEYVRRLPCCVPTLRKRHRKRGNRSGVRVRIRRAILSSIQSLMEFPLDSRSLEGLQLLRCSWDYRHVFHLPVFPDYHSSIFSAPPRLQIRQRGVNCSNVCQLDIGQHLKLDLSSQPPLNIALVNARSVCNKTFILHDFFTCWDLDILFLTETWAGAGELSVFEELCPSKCRFISTLRSAGRGGGVAMVF